MGLAHCGIISLELIADDFALEFMTMASSKDKVKRNNIAMGNLKLHRATAVCIIVTLLLLEQICTATSYQEAVIVFKKSWSVAGKLALLFCILCFILL